MSQLFVLIMQAVSSTHKGYGNKKLLEFQEAIARVRNPLVRSAIWEAPFVCFVAPVVSFPLTKLN